MFWCGGYARKQWENRSCQQFYSEFFKAKKKLEKLASMDNNSAFKHDKTCVSNNSES